MENNKIDISFNIILKVVAVILILFFFYLIREVIALLLVAIVVTASLNPIIRKIQQLFNFSRTYAVILVYFIFFATLSGIISFIFPILIHQFQEFYKSLPELLEKLLSKNEFLSNFSQNLDNFDWKTNLFDSIGGIFTKTISFVTGLISSLAIISMSFYMSLQENGLKKIVLLLTPKDYKKYVAHLVDEIYGSFGRWLTGLFFTMLFVGFFYYVGLSALGIPFAIVLALIGGLLEIIPYFGPIMAGIPAIILGFLQSPVIGFLVLVLYWLINLIENHILIPKIMNRAVGLNPVLIILSLLIGGKLGGVLGLFLAVPLAGAINVLVRDILSRQEEN